MRLGNNEGNNNIEDILKKLSPQRNFQTPEVTDINVKRDCEHCGKKNVCKYKERVEKVNNDLFGHKVFKFTEEG